MTGSVGLMSGIRHIYICLMIFPREPYRPLWTRINLPERRPKLYILNNIWDRSFIFQDIK